ncbi:hypothetical protein C8R47DRAFT_1220165 [Mycena vitilis]|nr:hypothetical protein C8R47DRAFT_1220165 [Mycena vitilis]
MPPSTDEEVTQLYRRARNKEPKFPGFAYGYLYATESSRRRIVAVPYNYGTQKLTSVDELFVHLWVPNSSLTPALVDMSVGRLRVNTLPGSSVPLEFSYSIVYVPPSSPLVNGENRCASLRSRVRWEGNILVLKHGKRKPVINMEREDAYLVDSIVSACIEEGLFR